jgi:diguanylate cyclase (GGDEF)-like protein
MKTEYFRGRVLASIDSILTYWDKNLVCRFANAAFSEWYNIEVAALVDKLTAKEVFGPVFDLNFPYFEKALQGQRQQFKRQVNLPNGKTIQAMAVYIPDLVDGRVYGVIVQVFDITHQQKIEDELAQAKARAEHLATHDQLTGVLNRTLIQDRVDSAISVSARTKTKVALCMLDVDDFKAINDTLGHLAGDAVLKTLADRFVTALRDHDSVARLGGDEFVIVLTNFGEEGRLADIVGRLLTSAGKPIDFNGHAILPSISLGISVAPDHGTSFPELLRMADEALYRSKTSGKHKITFYERQP